MSGWLTALKRKERERDVIVNVIVPCHSSGSLEGDHPSSAEVIKELRLSLKYHPKKWRLWLVAPVLKMEAVNIDFYHYHGSCCSKNLINKNDPQVLCIFGKGITPT